MNNLIKFVIIILFSIAPLANAQNTNEFQQIDESDQKLSKLIRSNSLQYWSQMKLDVYQESFRNFLTYKGIVTGDPHFGNFSLIPLKNKNGTEVLDFAYIDFDDSGHAPFVFDLLRLIITSKAIEWDLKTEDKFARIKLMLEAYVMGLNAQTYPMPEKISSELKKGLSEYNKKLSDLVKNRLDSKKSNKIKLVDGEIVALSASQQRHLSTIEKLFEGMKVLDVVRVLKERGGSANALRFLVLVKDSQNEKRLFELKQWQESGLNGYEPQKNILEWSQALYPVFWPNKSTEVYKLVKLKNDYFWKREKRKSLVDVPYEIENVSDLEFLQSLAPYVANQLGLIHGRQTSAAAYKKLLNNPSKQEELRQALKDSYKLYLEDAIKAF